MSTAADPKTLPITPEYAENHERIFGERQQPKEKVERRVWVMRCSKCDGVEHAPDAKLYSCDRCKDWTMGSVDAAIAPPLQEKNKALTAPIMVDRFYENTCYTTCDEKGQPLKVDIGSRMKHREFMRQRGLTTADDYKEEWKKAAKEREKIRTGEAGRKERRELLGRTLYEHEMKARNRK